MGYSPWGCGAGHNLVTKQQQTDPQSLPVKFNIHTYTEAETEESEMSKLSFLISTILLNIVFLQHYY